MSRQGAAGPDGHTADSDTSIMVSICCITYNHIAYLGQALDSFLAQRVEFPIEIVVHDDASTDGTQSVILEYQRRHPGRIRSILQTTNQYSRGKKPFLDFVLPSARGKYIAVCEGDDYWTDPQKLALQVAFLEAHPSFSMSFHNVQRAYEGPVLDVPTLFAPRDQRAEVTIDDLVVSCPIPTLSVVMRRELLHNLPSWLHTMKATDWPLFAVVAENGPAGFIDRVMGVHRSHPGGVWAYKAAIHHLTTKLATLAALEAHFGELHKTRIRLRASLLWLELANAYAGEARYSEARRAFARSTRMRPLRNYVLREKQEYPYDRFERVGLSHVANSFVASYLPAFHRTLSRAFAAVRRPASAGSREPS